MPMAWWASRTEMEATCSDWSCWVPAPFQPNWGSDPTGINGVRSLARCAAVAGLKFRETFPNCSAKASARAAGDRPPPPETDDEQDGPEPGPEGPNHPAAACGARLLRPPLGKLIGFRD